jgi:hypothetical protein
MGQEQSGMGGGFAYDDPLLRIPQQQAATVRPPPEEVIDIYDTGVSEGLRALLATLHEDDGLQEEKPGKLSAAAPEFVPTSLRWNASAPEFVPVVSRTISDSSLQSSVIIKTWWYRDPKGINRGPFSTSEMKAWSDQNYFPKDLLVARDENGPFIPLAELFPDSVPFARYMDIREFTQIKQTTNHSIF